MEFENIKGYCIHLSKRVDREENMYKELDYFVKGQYEVIEAIKDPIGKVGVSKSFKKVIREAKRLQLQQVLIFEDDIKFTSNKSKDTFIESMGELPKDWDVLLGGVYSDTNLFDYSENLKKVESFSSLHCVLIRDTMYDIILNHRCKDYETTHLDNYIGGMSKKGEINVFLTYPMVAIQHTGVSDTVNRNVDYSKMLEKYDILN